MVDEIRTFYFSDVYTMPQFIETIHKVPNNVLAILCLESAETHRLGMTPQDSVIRSIIDHILEYDQRPITFPVNAHQMCREIEHEFTMRYFNAEGYIKWDRD